MWLRRSAQVLSGVKEAGQKLALSAVGGCLWYLRSVKLDQARPSSALMSACNRADMRKQTHEHPHSKAADVRFHTN
eukprot:671857-Rhodomonas_salina.2